MNSMHQHSGAISSVRQSCSKLQSPPRCHKSYPSSCWLNYRHKRQQSRRKTVAQVQQHSQHQGIDPCMPQPMSKAPARPSVSVVTFLILLQALAVVGAFVGGWLARQRRLEVEKTNHKLRRINNELRKRQQDDDEAVLLEGNKKASAEFRTAMENALSGPSAAHPIEGYGSGSLSLAKARRHISQSLQEGKAKLQQQQPQEALELFKKAGQLSEELQDKRAARAIARATANAYQQVITHTEKLYRAAQETCLLDDSNMCLRSLTYSLQLSAELQDTSRDSDVLGEMADLYTEMGDLEKAGQFYDKCLLAMTADSSDITSSQDL